MNEETVVAESSSADDVFGGQQPTLDEYNSFRQSGELPARFKPADNADSTPADAPEETEKTEGEDPELAPDSDPEEKQELPPKLTPYEKRIKQLLAKTKELEEQLASKQGVKPESSPAQIEQQYANPKPTADDKNPDGTLKYDAYEDVVEAIGRWAAKEERAAWEREHKQQEALKALNSTLEEARERYEDADEIIFPAAKTINESSIPQAVKEVFAGSDLFIDLCYVVGSDPDELKQFIKLAQTNPRAAIGKVFEYERGIKEELAQSKGGKAPEPKKTSAPKPPSPVSGGSSRAFDVSDESLSPEEWSRKRTKELQNRK